MFFCELQIDTYLVSHGQRNSLLRLVFFCILQEAIGTNPAARIHTQVQGLTSRFVEANGVIRRDASAKQRIMRSELVEKAHAKSPSLREETKGSLLMMHGRCLELDSDNVTAKVKACHNGASQKWQLNRGRLKVMTTINQCVSVTKQHYVFLTECNATDSQQKWHFKMKTGTMAGGITLRKTGSSSQCLGINNVTLTVLPCASGDIGAHEKWFFADTLAGEISNKKVNGMCLDLDAGNKPIFADCSSERKQQRWYHYRGRLKTIKDASKCLQAEASTASGLSMAACNTETPKFVLQNHCFKVGGKVLHTFSKNGALKVNLDTKTPGPKFYFTQASALPLRSEKDIRCLEYTKKHGIVNMKECNLKNNQAWYIENFRLKTKQDASKCLGYDNDTVAKKLAMNACPGGANYVWTFKDKELKIETLQSCLASYGSDGNVKMRTCSKESKGQRWHFGVPTTP